ncbi:hypothetical protein PS943_04310 [Pseudomonas fluorescens]|uniref:Uncharacterized protein n=1 Tax=Pseudomonas fluorescens TaxID=294 RepID=A0A5E7WKI2_PSEFL|nr:hypothetical protein PS943_04310 [Pseudomonas fluorescens]
MLASSHTGYQLPHQRLPDAKTAPFGAVIAYPSSAASSPLNDAFQYSFEMLDLFIAELLEHFVLLLFGDRP